MQAIERKIAAALVDAALSNGYTLSVYDGEETTVKKSREAAIIMEALASTDHDLLLIKKQGGAFVGNVLLIWGNGEDLISDHTNSDAIIALVDAAQRLAECTSHQSDGRGTCRHCGCVMPNGEHQS